jgi:hypothetical protein
VANGNPNISENPMPQESSDKLAEQEESNLFNDESRKDKIKNHFYRIKILSIWTVVVLGLCAVVIRAFHIFAIYVWIDTASLSIIDHTFTSAFIGSVFGFFIGKIFK